MFLLNGKLKWLKKEIKSVEGIIVANGVSHSEGKSLVILNCEENPVDGELFPGFFVNGEYPLTGDQRVEINYFKGSKKITVDNIDYRLANRIIPLQPQSL